MSTFADYTDEANIVRLRAKGGGGGSQPVARVPISSAEILTFGTSAPRKVLVAAPGAGKVLLPAALFVSFAPGLTPYTINGGGFGFGWGDDGSGNANVWGNVAEFAADILTAVVPVSKVAVSATFDTDVNGSPPARLSDTADFEDAALTFGFCPNISGGDPPADGDGTLVVTVTYDVFTL